jgi:hypothetical protein
MLLLKELGMVLALACTIGVTTWETLHTAERLWQRVEAMLEMFQSVPRRARFGADRSGRNLIASGRDERLARAVVAGASRSRNPD